MESLFPSLDRLVGIAEAVRNLTTRTEPNLPNFYLLQTERRRGQNICKRAGDGRVIGRNIHLFRNKKNPFPTKLVSASELRKERD